MDYVIKCENIQEQRKVIELLKQSGYRWKSDENFVPLEIAKDGKIITNGEKLDWTKYANSRYRETHVFFTGEDFIKYKSLKLI